MWRRRRKPAEFSAEIEAHLELERAELVEDGMDEPQAQAAAQRKFGNRRAAEERFYERTRWLWLDHLWSDVRFSARSLTRSPVFTTAVVITLALAIGATTAIFNVVDEVLFRPLPLPEAEQLTAVYNYNPGAATYSDSSYPDYLDYRDHAQSFEQLSAYVRLPLAVSVGDHTMRLPVEAVTPEYFEMLRLRPLMGSTFGNDNAPEVLLSERVWRRELGADPATLGATVLIERQPFTLVGVIPESYRGFNFNWSEPPEAWIPLRTLEIPLPRFGPVFDLRAARWMVIFGRRMPGVTVEQAQAELRNIAENIAAAEPANADITVALFEAGRSKFWPAYRAPVVLSLGVFGLAAALVLLLASANISHLLLERALARRREIAVRLALGAQRARLIRQMLVESFLLVTPGFIAALLVSRILAKLVAHYPGAIGEIPLWFEPQTDARVLLFGLLLSVGAAVLIGIVPAVQATRSGPQSVLKKSAHEASFFVVRDSSSLIGRRHGISFRETMIVAQIALTTILLVGGGLFARSLLRGYAIDPGFRSDHLMVSTFDFNALPPGERAAFQARLLDESVNLPGVESAAISPHLPLISAGISAQLMAPDGATQLTNLRYAGAGFFHTMGVPLLAGREFIPADAPSEVAVVSEDLAAWLGLGANAIGRTLRVRRDNIPEMELEVIGIVGAVRASVWEAPEPQIYVPSEASTQFWILRTHDDPAHHAPAIHELWSRIAPEIPMWNLQTGDELVAGALAPQRLAVRLFAGFGLLAITLAAIGIYSLTACSVARRAREIGLRIAIGATPSLVVRQILARTLWLTTLGLAPGLAAAIKLSPLASPLLREISPTDAATFLTVVALLLATSCLATLIPAHRAARVEPAAILRSE